MIHVNDYPANLTVAQQQMVEIARALSVDSKILIMDEPTASLTERETVQLLEFVQMLKNQELQSFIFHIVWMKYSRSQTGLRCSVMDST